LWRPALPVLVLLGGQLALRAGGLDVTALLARLAGQHHGLAELVFVPAAAALCFVGVPRQVVAYAGGLGFGAVGGTLLALAGTLAGCAASFAWARRVARNWVQSRLPSRLARADRMLATQPFTAALTLRLLPVGNNLLLNLAAGVSAIRPLPFLLGSLLGYLPQTIVFALVGAGTRIGHGTMIALGVGLFAVCGALGVVLMRRMRTV
jgi:uncharacterized membrane protein YdjX (TVP38/TMEM64 family)